MKSLLALLLLSLSNLVAAPLVYNNLAWYTGHDPHLIGKRENFMIQSVTLEAIRTGGAFSGEFRAIIKFNYGGPTPAIGNLSTISPYTFGSGGVNSVLHAADLFFRQNGTLRYGIPLVDHGGAPLVNGHSLGLGTFDDGDLYHIADGIHVVTANEFLTAGTNPANFGSGRAVWLAQALPNPQALMAGSTQIRFNGLCTETVCPEAEYTVTLNLAGAPTVGTDWYYFLLGISNGTITPYFTGTTCGNDLLVAPVPEPSSLALFAASGLLLLFRASRRN